MLLSATITFNLMGLYKEPWLWEITSTCCNVSFPLCTVFISNYVIYHHDRSICSLEDKMGRITDRVTTDSFLNEEGVPIDQSDQLTPSYS